MLQLYYMKQSNQQKTNSGQRRYEKNKNRISDKPHMSKHERWEMMERLRIITEALSGNPKK